jgi:hypothetical protein
MINLHSVGIVVTMCGGIFATFVSCAVAMIAARKATRRTKRTRRAQRA